MEQLVSEYSIVHSEGVDNFKLDIHWENDTASIGISSLCLESIVDS